MSCDLWLFLFKKLFKIKKDKKKFVLKYFTKLKNSVKLFLVMPVEVTY
jgi:hypothetical protein